MYPHQQHHPQQYGPPMPQQPDWRTQQSQAHTLPPLHAMAVPSNQLPPSMYAPMYPPQGMQQYGAMPPHHMQPQMQPAMPQMQVQPQVQPSTPMLLSHSGQNDTHRFTLVIEQQPQRARMCGFGDKDRRPITPPPCVRLYITDIRTGKEVDANNVEGSFYVLQVDLWNEKADREANVVRASNTSPTASISTATTTSYPPTSSATMGSLSYPSYPPGYPGLQVPQNSNNMFTRNLIGSLTVNAAKLSDNKGKTAYWFVLQDLSVRTEGHFRLRMNFIDVGVMANDRNAPPTLNRGKAPVLAHVFSDPFQVYSAKKFPGVIESTELSKTFARQGIKIPIRKDAKEGGKEEDDDE